MNTEHYKRKLKQRHVIYYREITNDKYRIIPHTQIQSITSLQSWRLSTLYVNRENNTAEACV